MPTNNQKWRNAQELRDAVEVAEAIPVADYGVVLSEPADEKLFDITGVVGSVYAGGDQNPRVVAFEIIGGLELDGTFSFPAPDGSMVSITVNTTRVKPDAR